ncbi:MAG: flagellar basal body-associated FliL family protein [Succinivibrio sp.]|jgi:flagellar FliL protein|nr:flagellar basal body-associated FliL family protein [Succinivibrio sp.]
MIKNFFKAIAVFFALPFFAVPAYAGHGSAPEPAEEEVVEPEIGYYAITPDVVTNLATLNPRDKLHFVRIKMSLMLSDSRDSAIIADVEPVIKDSIVTILGAKEFAQIASNESRERIRIECREKMISLLNEKFGKPIIMDVLFLSYVYQ